LSIHSPTHGFDAIWHSVIDPFVELFTYSSFFLRMATIFGVGFCWAELALWRNKHVSQLVDYASVAIAAVLAVTVGRWRADGDLTQQYYIALITPVLLMAAISVALITKPGLKKSYATMAFAAVVASFPEIFSIGSGSRLIYHACQASIYWFAASMIIATMAPAETRVRVLTGTLLFSSLLTVGVLVGAIADPYRLQAPLWEQTERVEIGTSLSSLLVDRPTAHYLQAMQKATATYGFQAGTPIIDLTGGSPGTVFALGGEAPGIPWLSGGYVGSAAYVQETLSQVPHEHLRRAWVLTASGTRNALPDDILRALGLNFPQAYQMVAKTCLGAPCVDQMLWKPLAN